MNEQLAFLYVEILWDEYNEIAQKARMVLPIDQFIIS